eukprot:2222827-Amphidinium_carterae.1
MLREIELATARRNQVELRDGPGCGIAVVDLPVSKTDFQALGKKRAHGCACPSLLCPVAAMR